MKLEFLGTKGEIEESSRKHKYHSSLLIKEKNFKLLIDYGMCHKNNLKKIKPNAILITHAHLDHFIFLKKDEEYKGKIYVSKETKKLAKFKKKFKIIKIGKWFKIGSFKILAYKVMHSLIAPAIGFKIRISKNKKFRTLIYNPDLVDIIDKNKILKNLDLYIGDGSSIKTNLIRKKGNKLFGHAKIQTQINWCKKYKIKNIIFTHLGKEALEFGDNLEKHLKQKNKNFNIKIANDKMVYELK